MIIGTLPVVIPVFANLLIASATANSRGENSPRH